MYKNIPNSFYHEMNKLRILNHIETMRDNLQIVANTLEITQPDEVYNNLNNIKIYHPSTSTSSNPSTAEKKDSGSNRNKIK